MRTSEHWNRRQLLSHDFSPQSRFEAKEASASSAGAWTLVVRVRVFDVE